MTHCFERLGQPLDPSEYTTSLQSALVFVNTLLLQRILADQPIELTAEDRRAISPLFWTHVRPYGTFQLHLDRHLDLEPHPVSA